MRTIVEPSAMASSKSSLMPMLRWRSGPADLVPAQLLEDFAGAGEGLADLVLGRVERAHGHEPDELEVGHRVDLLGQVNRGADRDAELLDSSLAFTWSSSGVRLSLAD